MRLTWDTARKRSREGNDHNKASPFRTTSQQKLRYSLAAPGGIVVARGMGGNGNKRKGA